MATDEEPCPRPGRGDGGHVGSGHGRGRPDRRDQRAHCSNRLRVCAGEREPGGCRRPGPRAHLRGRREGEPGLRRAVPSDGGRARRSRNSGDAERQLARGICGWRTGRAGRHPPQRSAYAARADAGWADWSAGANGRGDQPGAGSAGRGQPDGHAARVHTRSRKGQRAERGGRRSSSRLRERRPVESPLQSLHASGQAGSRG